MVEEAKSYEALCYLTNSNDSIWKEIVFQRAVELLVRARYAEAEHKRLLAVIRNYPIVMEELEYGGVAR